MGFYAFHYKIFLAILNHSFKVEMVSYSNKTSLKFWIALLGRNSTKKLKLWTYSYILKYNTMFRLLICWCDFCTKCVLPHLIDK